MTNTLRNAGFLDQLDILTGEERRECNQRARQRRLGKQIIIDLLPFMPSTLGTTYQVSSLRTSPSYTDASKLGDIHLSLEAVGDVDQPGMVDRMLGTITKMGKALTRQGWEVRNKGKARESFDPKGGLSITVSASKAGVSLHCNFDCIPNTENCKLVEREVTVASHYVPEHQEKQMVVECTD
ncbi:hypothetical protein LCGC14_0410050 [marine sediment metagenome]|uniref:Uncharacterized protein n=1 Tax=marine sediment metagenome TaxID=412755 RepID=A0A0F9VG49_9ZZZZ